MDGHDQETVIPPEELARRRSEFEASFDKSPDFIRHDKNSDRGTFTFLLVCSCILSLGLGVYLITSYGRQQRYDQQPLIDTRERIRVRPGVQTINSNSDNYDYQTYEP